MRRAFAALGVVSSLWLACGVTSAAAQPAGDIKLCRNTEKPDDVIRGCTRIIDAPSTSSEIRASALSRRGSAYAAKKDFDRALDDANRAVAMRPKDPGHPYTRAMIYSAKGDTDRAIQDYDETLRLSPKLVFAISARGQLYADKKQFDRALADFDEALRLAPKDSWTWNSRARLMELRGDQDRALRDYNEAIRYDQKNPRFFVNRGMLYSDKGDLDRALTDLDTAIRLDPKLGLAYSHRGTVLRKKGEIDKARASYQRALELDPTLDTARVAVLELEKGNLSPGVAPAPSAASSAPSVAALKPSPLPELPLSASEKIPEKRVALVIGNSAYENVAALPNPANDARVVADTLRKVGFNNVRSVNNVKRDALVNTLKAFAAEAESADWAVVYYAGHGIEVGGINWLIPVDAALKTDRDVQFEAVAIEQVLGSVDGVKKLALVVLDACRDNPFAAQMRSTSATRSVGRGLAPVEPRRGTLVAYAAKHGQTALDGTGANSPFATALVKHMQTPGLEINKVFRLVRDEVLDTTNSRQEPFIYGTLPAQDFFFASR